MAANFDPKCFRDHSAERDVQQRMFSPKLVATVMTWIEGYATAKSLTAWANAGTGEGTGRKALGSISQFREQVEVRPCDHWSPFCVAVRKAAVSHFQDTIRQAVHNTVADNDSDGSSQQDGHRQDFHDDNGSALHLAQASPSDTGSQEDRHSEDRTPTAEEDRQGKDGPDVRGGEETDSSVRNKAEAQVELLGSRARQTHSSVTSCLTRGT